MKKNLLDTTFETSRGKHALNPFLIVEKGLDRAAVEKIMDLHRQKDLIFDRMETETDPILLNELTELEFKLQEAWGFKKDEMYHRHWEIPRCSCPVIDNQDDYPFQKHYNGGCVWHGM